MGVIYAAIGFAPEDARVLPPAMFLAWMLIPTALVGMPFAYWLPIARARFMGVGQRVPRNTYLMSRPIVCFVATSMIAVVIGNAILTIWIDLRYALLGIGQLFGAVAFVASAAKRFARHPASEFVLPSPMFYLLRLRM
jgi:hypothetical protein